MSEKEKLAQQHADWMIELLTPIIRHIAYQEFLHGYKHGVESVCVEKSKQ